MIIAHDNFEKQFWSQKYNNVIGIDEVGRGAWAGPAVVAGVIFPPNIELDYSLADSKLLTKTQRENLYPKIIRDSFKYKIITISLAKINQIGITNAIQAGFKKLIDSTNPDYVLIDGFKIKNYDQEKQLAIVKGDQQSISIAAASILAKVYRDNLMQQLSLTHPNYNFSNNVGYGTKQHQEALLKFGLSESHRLNYNLAKWLPPTINTRK